jgi:2-dehydropantoate 2-reductase
MTEDTLLVWGAGAIGGTVGAHWCRAGFPVLFVDRSSEHVCAVNDQGLNITGPVEHFRARAKACMPEEVSGTFRRAFLCVKAQDTDQAAKALAPHVAADGYVVSLQNGLNEELIARRLGVARTVGAFVNFGADQIAPGVIHYAGRGAVVVGELDGSISSRLQEIQRLLQLFEPQATITQNISGFLWSKLAYGALLFATALTNESIADCFAAPEYRPLFTALAREVLGIARASGIAPEPFDGFEPAVFLGGSSQIAEQSLAALVVHNRLSAKTHSGIWRDLVVRKRKTEARAQLGAVIEAAANLGRSVPLARRTLELIEAIELGVREPSADTFEMLRMGVS